MRGSASMSLTLLANALIANFVYAHPGGLDANGGHHDRRTGSYHFHRSGPSIVRLEPRLEPRTMARVAARMEPRKTAPLVREITEGATPGPIHETLEYEIIDKRTDAIHTIFRIRLLSEPGLIPSDRDVLRIANECHGESPMIAMFYLPEMDLLRNAWATVTIDRDSDPRVHIFPSRVPKSWRPG